MAHSKQAKADVSFLETPMGIITQRGNWFHTTKEQIELFAPGLLGKIPLHDLIKEAEAWIQSTDSLSLIILFALLFFIKPWLAAVITVVFHGLWYHVKSGFIVRSAGNTLRFFNSDIVQFIIAFFSLSMLGYAHHYVAAGIGFAFFFLMKPGLLRKGWEMTGKKKSSDKLPLNDQVLKMVIVKHAMYEDVAPSSIQKMEERIKDLALSRKKGGPS